MAILDLLKHWDIEENVVRMTFDSTASNTAEKNGSAALIEQHVGRALLWLTCRRHIYELHINTESTSQGGKNGPFFRKRLKKVNPET